MCDIILETYKTLLTLGLMGSQFQKIAGSFGGQETNHGGDVSLSSLGNWNNDESLASISRPATTATGVLPQPLIYES